MMKKKADNAVSQLSTSNMPVKNYQVFPGIWLTYQDTHTPKEFIHSPSPNNIFEIKHCKEGRIEYQLEYNYYYLDPEDLAIALKGTIKQQYFPLDYYQGLIITIDIHKSPKCLSCFLKDVTVSPSALLQKFCMDDKHFISHSNPSIKHIFYELYSVPDSIKIGYFKVKILELLLFLSVMDITENNHSLSKEQITLTQNICKYLTANMNKRITLKELQDKFYISGTQIKKFFKILYGVSVYSYIRTQKMQKAALVLLKTNSTILEIAGYFGYDNGSKFAKAFKDIMGMMPNEFRKANKFTD